MTTATVIYKRLSQLEQELQRLKLETYRTLPRPSKTSPHYADKAIYQAVKGTRGAIWQKRYAKRVARIR